MSSARVVCRCCGRPAVWREGERRWLLESDASVTGTAPPWHRDHPVDPVRAR